MDKLLKILALIMVVVIAVLLMFEFGDKKTVSITELVPVSASLETEKFDWFEDVEASALDNVKEVSKLWRSKPRCCKDKEVIQQNNREFYKACYLSMAKYPRDRDIGAVCLWLMPSGVDSKEQRIRIRELFLRDYFYYDRLLDSCANCDHANISARIAMSLARQYKSDKRLDDAISLLEQMNDERRDEMSDWVLAEFSTLLGKLYQEDQLTAEKIERLDKNYQTLLPLKNNKTLGKRSGKSGRFDKFEIVYKQLKHNDF